ncbi:MAG TPA: hypothetical protein VFH99_02005 [Candidatus Saccharimonadales bacterium]|nr:hypothetical protein [Candidatus Saccharimonadales bacterium]
MPEFQLTEPGTVKSIPSKRLDQQIRAAVLQYDWDSHPIGDLYDPDEEKPMPESYASDDQLLRIILLCRARSPDWQKPLQKAITHADLARYRARRPRHIVAETPQAGQIRNELYQEMASRLIDPLTFKPIYINGMGIRKFSREVADGNIVVEYSLG